MAWNDIDVAADAIRQLRKGCVGAVLPGREEADAVAELLPEFLQERA